METWNYLWHYIFLFYLCAEATKTLREGTSQTITTAQSITKGPTSRAPGSSNGTTEASSDATSHSFVSHSSAPSWTPGVMSIGSGATTSETMTSSPVLGMTSPKPLNSAASRSPDSDTTQISLVPTMAVSMTTPVVPLTSGPLTQGQTTEEVAATSSSTGNPFTVTSLVSTASHATTSSIMNERTGMTAEPHAQTSLSLPATSLVIPFTMGTAGGQRRTETASATPSPEGSSLTVSVRSKVTSLTSMPDTTVTDVSTASGSDASLTLSPNLPVMSHSSSPPGSSDATSVLQQSSTSGTTVASSDITSHASMELISSAPSWTPRITSMGSDATTAQTMTSSPVLTMTSPKPLNSAASMSSDSDTTQISLVPTMAVSVTTPVVLLTSGPLTQGQTTEEVAATSSSTGNPLTASSMASAASHVMTPPTEDKSPITNQGTVMTAEPNAKTSLSLPATSLVITSTMRTADGQESTETMATTPVLEHSSPGMLSRTEATSFTFSTTRSNTTAKASGSAASPSLSPGLPVTIHASSTPAGSSSATHSLQQGSTSGISEAGLDATSHTSTEVDSSTISSTPGIISIGSGVVTEETVTSSPAPSSLSTKPAVSTVETQTALLTSRPLTQEQVTVEAGNTSSSTGTFLSAVSTASAASRVTTPDGKTDQASSTTAEPKANTSLSLAVTPLVTEFMTNFRKSTSANPSCLPVSIEVQNVTGEAIQLSWTGGRRDSPYTISLMYGNQEINVTDTKETKMMFENLLPSRVYKISVAASPCAGSSVTVRTDSVSCFRRIQFCSPQNTGCDDFKSLVCSYSQAFACSVLLKNQTFNRALYNSESEDYRAMSKNIKTEVVGEMRMKLNDDRFDIIVLGFKPGSVIAYFISVMQTEEPMDVNVIQTQLNQVLKSKFGDQADVTVRSFSVQSSTETSSSWKVAVIVLGVLLGVALVLLLLVTSVCIYMRKRSGKYAVEAKGLLGNFAYKHL